MRNFIKKVFHLFNLELSNLPLHKKFVNTQNLIRDERDELKDSLNRLNYILDKFPASECKELSQSCFIKYVISKLPYSKSQLFQDLFVLYCLNDKTNGYFIEFGATNGLTLSNTWLLEKKYKWTGILAEPAIIWQDNLKQNRSCFIDTQCVWSKSGQELTFVETDIAELSTIDSFSKEDYHNENRKVNNKSYLVQTVSFNDLLSKYDAPTDIDYVSIDTEGSEYEILLNIDFNRFKIKIITVEHNFTSKREDINRFLTQKGFTRVFEAISLFDDWYVNDSIKKLFAN